MGDFALGLLVGAALALYACGLYVENTVDSLHNTVLEMQSMVETCQTDLPRNQRCILVAQPEE